MRDLRDAAAGCGGKAAGLARLLAAGLRVPPGFAVCDGEAIDGDAVVARAKRLGDWLVVRSSSAIEDGDDASAAGVFASVVDVRPADVAAAIAEVRASANAPAARAYAARRGVARVAMSVVVQPMIDGVRVTVYTRPPNRPDGDQVWLQRGEALSKLARDATEPAVAMALAAERAIGATRGADVEIVVPRDGEPWLVQARAIVHRAHEPLAPATDELLAPLRDGRTWTWDVAHNPDPLSPAQQGLVARVATRGDYELRVCHGYLYSTPRHAPPAPPRDAADLAKRAKHVESLLTKTTHVRELGPPDLEIAIPLFQMFYSAWSQLSSLLATVPRNAASRPSAVETTLLRAARGELTEAQAIAELGPRSPAWDIAVPTYAEQPQLVRDAIARIRDVAAPSFPPLDDLRALAADLRERDDLYFARAHLTVRRAILARAAELGLAADDAFWVPLDELVAGHVTSDPAAARAAAAAQARTAMPGVVAPHGDTLAEPPTVHGALHGHGSGGRATGRVVRFASLATASARGTRRGDVVVARAVTPALAVLVAGCAALVSETGGPLDHGAALARELGIPCVVGCHGAWSQLLDGTLVLVDGDRGVVEQLG
nr:PEP-utilizing enzyme [Kofleriaceae bacterium]